MKLSGEGKLLRIFLGELDKHKHQPLYEAIVLKAREMGLAGATVFRGIEGFGASSRVIHTAKILRLSEDLPLIVEIVDTEEKIREFLPTIDTLFEEVGCGGLVTMEKAEVIKYTSAKGKKIAVGEEANQDKTVGH
jgi:PII-like signaling protein